MNRQDKRRRLMLLTQKAADGGLDDDECCELAVLNRRMSAENLAREIIDLVTELRRHKDKWQRFGGDLPDEN